ncbi:MAG: beta-galactosidase, partial [FCB group bacterium]|nr:beta-galactosidase [FCB group bacterium]
DLIKNRSSIVFARAIDSLQRVVAMSTREVEGLTAEVSLDLDFADLVTSRVKVEVYVLGAPIGVSGINREPSEFELNRAAFSYRWFPVRQSLDPHAFTFIATGGASSEYNVRTAYRTLQSLGVDTVETWANDADTFFGAEAALRVLPRLTSYADATVDDVLRRSPCLSDPAFLRSEAAAIEEASRNPWVEDAGRYSLGDGNRLASGGQNLCQSDTCLQGFRTRIEAEYGTIERLQAAWQTYAGEWNALKPIALADATASGVYPPWVDFRQYMDAVFTSAHTMARDIVRVQSPKARIGFASMPAPGLYSGYAWSQLATELDLLGVPPESLAVDKVRSYRPANSTALLMCGEGFSPLDETHVRWIPWYAALHGFSGVWYKGALGSVESVSPAAALLPDARPIPAFHALADEMALLRQGIAAVLLRAERSPASIAFYDSAASRYLNAAETSFGVDSPAAEASVTTILKSLGFAFDYVSPDTDPERLKQYRVLVLPMARALSDGEVDAIRAFHASGGHVLADVAPASFDEHGARRDTPALAELFGVKWDGPSGSNESAADAAAIAFGAEAKSQMGDVPLWLNRKNGEAWAVLINQALPAGAETDSNWIESFRGALTEMGIVPAVSFEEPFHGECSVLRYGKATLYGLLRAPEGGEEVETVALNLGKGYAFDLRQGMPVPRKKATFRLRRGEAALVARLPYDVLELELGAPQSVAPGRRIPLHLSLKTRGGLPGEHVVRVEFGPAGGAPLRHYGRDVICKEGNADAYIALSQRERPGLYNVIAWDALTGLSAQTTVRIESEPIPEH